MGKRKIIAAISITIVVAVAVILSVSLRKHGKNEINAESTAVSTSVATGSALSEEESGDSFNTDDLDTGIDKEGRSTGGLAHGVDETETSTEASEPETYAETDAEGKNLTEPAQIANSDTTNLSEKDQKKVTEEQRNAYDVKYGMVLYGYNGTVICLVILLFLFMLFEFFGALFKIIKEYKGNAHIMV